MYIYYNIFLEVRKVKNKNNLNKEKKPYIKTKQRLDGGKEVEITKSPSETGFGKFVALALAVLTILGTVIALIVLIVQASK